jgi:hypothetical protein
MLMGEPQVEQKVRSATSESFKVRDVEDVVNLIAAGGMCTKGR